MHYKFQPLVFNTFWENDFSTFSPYKCMGTQIWPCHTNLVDLESSMLSRVSFEAFLILEKKIFKCFYHIWAWRPSCSISLNHLNKLAILFWQKAPFEIWWKWLKWFQRRRHLKKIHNFFYMYLFQRQRQITLKGQNFIKLKSFTTLFTHYKFQPLVFNTFWENDFSTFSPYKCMRTQIWSCHKNVRGPLTVIIWTNLVDLESSVLSRVSFQALLVLEKKIFKCFYYIWAWRSSYSISLNHLKKLSILFWQKAPFEIRWKLLKWFQRRRH